jgi:glycosyltransferase involved in cell wall biosynthesis
MLSNQVEISIVVPVYNSARTITEFVERVKRAMQWGGLTYELILTDDFSSDNTWNEISNLCSVNAEIIGLRLDKNYGQWCSTLAGMSVATGRYIVTIDDDLEYDPFEINMLYKAITTKHYAVVFGMSEEKYPLQGKNRRLSKFRNGLLNALWNKPPSDSFKILERKFVFDDRGFAVGEPLDAFIKHRLAAKNWGHYQVSFSKRYAGNSGHSLAKKIKLFFVYSAYFSTNIKRNALIFSGLFLLLVFGTGVLLASHSLSDGLLFIPEFAICITGLINLYYTGALLSKPKRFPLYSIAGSINLKP